MRLPKAKPLSAGLAAAGVAMTSACANSPTYPAAMKPQVPGPVIYQTLTPSTRLLDCQSSQMLQRHGERYRVVLGKLDNTVGKSVGTVALPTSLRPATRSALARLDAPFILFDNMDMSGMWAVPEEAQKMGQIAPFNSADALIEGEVIKADLVIEGELFAGEVRRSAEQDTEIAILGVGSKVKVTDIEIQLYWKNAVTRQIIGAPISLRARLYEAEQGASAFVVHGEEYSRYKYSFVDQAPGIFTVQYLVDTGVATLTRDLAANHMGIDLSSCDAYAPFVRLPMLDPPTSTPKPLKVTYDSQKGFCTITTPELAASLPPRVIVRWRQFRSSNIELQPQITAEFTPGELSGGMTCLPINLVKPITRQAEVSYESTNGDKIIAAGRSPLF